MFAFKPLLGLEPMAPIRPQLLVSHSNHSATCMYVCMYVCNQNNNNNNNSNNNHHHHHHHHHNHNTVNLHFINGYIGITWDTTRCYLVTAICFHSFKLQVTFVNYSSDLLIPLFTSCGALVGLGNYPKG